MPCLINTVRRDSKSSHAIVHPLSLALPYGLGCFEWYDPTHRNDRPQFTKQLAAFTAKQSGAIAVSGAALCLNAILLNWGKIRLTLSGLRKRTKILSRPRR